MYKVASFHYLAGHLDIDPIEDKHMDTYNYIPTVVQIWETFWPQFLYTSLQPGEIWKPQLNPTNSIKYLNRINLEVIEKWASNKPLFDHCNVVSSLRRH